MSSLWESRRSKKRNEENKKIKASGSAVWSEEDEYSLLKAMIDYEVIKQSNPYDDMGKFLDFVKPLISFDVQRKQLTDKLWGLKNKFLNSKYDSSIPRHANLLELSKSITSWGQHANMSLDVKSDDQNVNVDSVVDDDVDLDKLVDKLSKVVENEKKGKLVSSDGRIGKLVKCSKKKGKVVSSDDQTNNMDDVVVEDVEAGKRDLVVKDKGKGDVEEDYVVDDFDIGKSSKVGKTGKKGKIVTCGVRNGKGDNVAIDDDFCVDKVLEVGKKKRKLVTRDGEIVKEAEMVLDEVNGRKYSKKKGKFVIRDGQNNEENDVVVGDVVTRDNQIVQENTIANAVVDDVQSPKKNGKERVKVLGDKNVHREVNREDLKKFTSMFPQLTNMLELETLSRMPQTIKKKCVVDTINSMGWEKAKELEEEWADVHLMEMKLKAKKLDLTSKQMYLILEAMRRGFKP